MGNAPSRRMEAFTERRHIPSGLVNQRVGHLLDHTHRITLNGKGRMASRDYPRLNSQQLKMVKYFD